MITGMLDSGALPTLERLVQFTGERHRVLTHNIANLDTPYYKPTDLDPKGFQAELRSALEKRRRQPNPVGGQLALSDTAQLRFEKDRIVGHADPTHTNILFHDQNNRDLDRTMQSLVENTMTHTAGIDMLKNQFEMLKTAIRERL